ncbi:hypothetical protein ACNJYD_19490 [Bradyrhizobium sp. DASA03005]|uniref:hypothetical protein n=1 Tax=Bradyrhizobium sp. SPXBL-02 TaxID=3395912 RepID=UPI003F7203D3
MRHAHLVGAIHLVCPAAADMVDYAFGTSTLRDLALPDGQNTQASGQSTLAEIFAFTEFRLCRILVAPHPLSEGRIAIVTNAG